MLHSSVRTSTKLCILGSEYSPPWGHSGKTMASKFACSKCKKHSWLEDTGSSSYLFSIYNSWVPCWPHKGHIPSLYLSYLSQAGPKAHPSSPLHCPFPRRLQPGQCCEGNSYHSQTCSSSIWNMLPPQSLELKIKALVTPFLTARGQERVIFPCAPKERRIKYGWALDSLPEQPWNT